MVGFSEIKPGRIVDNAQPNDNPIHPRIVAARERVNKLDIVLSPKDKEVLVTYWLHFTEPTSPSAFGKRQKLDYEESTLHTANFLGIPKTTVRNHLDEVLNREDLRDAFSRLEKIKEPTKQTRPRKPKANPQQ